MTKATTIITFTTPTVVRVRHHVWRRMSGGKACMMSGGKKGDDDDDKRNMMMTIHTIKDDYTTINQYPTMNAARAS